MSRIPAILAAHCPALIPFITGGFPTMQVTKEALLALDRAQGGAGVIEVGFPFTDPIADGPIIAESMHEALLKGATPHAIFDVVKEVRAHVQSGIVAMVTDSIITRMGSESFVKEAAAAGFDGLIVPDVDLDAAVPLSGLAKLHGLSFTLLVAPTTRPERIARIVSLCSGFVYVLARVGITGESTTLNESSLTSRIELIRTHTPLPLAVGFGISTPEDVRAVTRLADAAIVGSALVRRMQEVGESQAAAVAAHFVSQLAVGLFSRSPTR